MWCSFILTAPRFLLNGSSVAENVSWSTQTVKLQHPVRQGERRGLDTSLIPLPFSPSHHYPPMDTHVVNTVKHLHTTHTVLYNWDVMKVTGEDLEQQKLNTWGWNPLAKVVKCPQSSTHCFSESDHQRKWGLKRGNKWRGWLQASILQDSF